MRLVAISNRNVDKAVEAYKQAEVDDVHHVDDGPALDRVVGLHHGQHLGNSQEQVSPLPERHVRGLTVHREVEHKFRVHGLFRLPDLSPVAEQVDDLGTFQLASTYFDTTDLRLAREGISLRRRTGSPPRKEPRESTPCSR
jgi:hypothetical protein